jgi:hypothetical protein
MKNYHLSPAEQETIICWNNELDAAEIYTHDRRIGKRLLELSIKYPELFILKEKGCQNCLQFVVPKQVISIRQPYSEERRKKQSREAKEKASRFGSPFAVSKEALWEEIS